MEGNTQIVIECANNDCDKKLMVRTSSEDQEDVISLTVSMSNWYITKDGEPCCSMACLEKVENK